MALPRRTAHKIPSDNSSGRDRFAANRSRCIRPSNSATSNSANPILKLHRASPIRHRARSNHSSRYRTTPALAVYRLHVSDVARHHAIRHHRVGSRRAALPLACPLIHNDVRTFIRDRVRQREPQVLKRLSSIIDRTQPPMPQHLSRVQSEHLRQRIVDVRHSPICFADINTQVKVPRQHVDPQ